MRILLVDCLLPAHEVSPPGRQLADELQKLGIECRRCETSWSAAATNEELATYRAELRDQLNALVDQFNPDVIHAQRVWPWAQLALETGVPYVVTLDETEMSMLEQSPQLLPFSQQGVENCGCLVLIASGLKSRLRKLFGELDDAAESVASTTEALISLYTLARNRRTGHLGPDHFSPENQA